MNKEKAALERERLFKIIEDLVQWENTNNEEVLERARAEIRRSWRETCELNKNHPRASELFNPDRLPAFHDPFAGGGAIPLDVPSRQIIFPGGVILSSEPAGSSRRSSRGQTPVALRLIP